MTFDQKKALFVFGMAAFLFLLVKPALKKKQTTTSIKYFDEEEKPTQRKKMNEPTMSEKTQKSSPKIKNSFLALKAYIAAYNAGEPQSALDELNRELAKEYSVRVYRRKSDGKLVVCDLTGTEILVNNG